MNNLNNHKYTKITTDPPWSYNQRCPHTKTKSGGGCTDKYPLITDKDLLKHWAPWIDSIAADDCVMFQWSVCPKLDFCIEFGKACGFKYVTVSHWWEKLQKDGRPAKGTGYYTSANVEPVLLFVRGKPPKPAVGLTDSIIQTYVDDDWIGPEPTRLDMQRGKHSEKPLELKRLIDKMYPTEIVGKGLGIFERSPQPGWDVFGNELLSDIAGPDGSIPEPLHGQFLEQQRLFL